MARCGINATAVNNILMVKGETCNIYIYIIDIRILPIIAWVRGILRDFIQLKLFYVSGITGKQCFSSPVLVPNHKRK